MSFFRAGVAQPNVSSASQNQQLVFMIYLLALAATATERQLCTNQRSPTRPRTRGPDHVWRSVKSPREDPVPEG